MPRTECTDKTPFDSNVYFITVRLNQICISKNKYYVKRLKQIVLLDSEAWITLKYYEKFLEWSE